MHTILYIIIIIIIIIIILILILLIYFDCFTHYINNVVTIEDIIYADSVYQSLPRVKLDGKTVISFTSIPSRINKIGPTLFSILNQTHKVDEIRLNLPYTTLKGERYEIEKWLLNLKNLKIYRFEFDWGPASKLLPTVQDKSNIHIIIIDDDISYGREFVKIITNLYYEHDYKDAICMIGSDFSDTKYRRLWSYLTYSRYVEILSGCAGYILNSNMILTDIFNYKDGPKEAIYVDDDWISGWLRRNDINIYMVGYKYGAGHFFNINTLGTEALSNVFNSDGKNSKIVYEWFAELE